MRVTCYVLKANFWYGIKVAKPKMSRSKSTWAVSESHDLSAGCSLDVCHWHAAGKLWVLQKVVGSNPACDVFLKALSIHFVVKLTLGRTQEVIRVNLHLLLHRAVFEFHFHWLPLSVVLFYSSSQYPRSTRRGATRPSADAARQHAHSRGGFR